MKKTIFVIAALVFAVAAQEENRGEMMTAQESGWSSDVTRFRLYSVRSEYELVFNEIGTFGLRLEYGIIDDESGFFLTGDFGGGANYCGGGLNAGYRFTNNTLRLATGISGGYHNTELVTDFVNSHGFRVMRRVGRSAAFAGAFLKVMPWEAENFDITTRVMFGHRKNSTRYDKVNEEIYMKSGFSAVWSVSAGYTLLKRSGN